MPHRIRTQPPPGIATPEEFYVHALAIEREAAERYAEFEGYFDGRGEEVLAGLCRNLARAEREHFDELVRTSAHLTLPAIAAGDHRWLEADAPEAPARDLLYRVATPRQLLEIALAAELRARAFFVSVACTARSVEVRELASIMAAEEVEHVKWVGQALQYHTTESVDWETLLAAGVGPGVAQT
jgi:rubrerythrin